MSSQQQVYIAHNRKASDALCMLVKREKKSFQVPAKTVKGTWRILQVSNSIMAHSKQQWTDARTPDTKVFPDSDGERSRLMTSPMWPVKHCSISPLSTSHRQQVPSPLPVSIYTHTDGHVWNIHTQRRMHLTHTHTHTHTHTDECVSDTHTPQKPACSSCYLKLSFYAGNCILHALHIEKLIFSTCL